MNQGSSYCRDVAAHRAVVTLALSLGCACGPLAAAEGAADERTFFDEPATVLSLSRMPQPIGAAPGAVTVIDRETIRASGARTIPDVLRLVPGMNVGFKNGHTASVAYHAYTDDFARRMQVLIDGRSVFTPFFVGGVDWASWPIALDDIETIEVVRGTNSVAYGSNAFLGVVNIITRTAAEGRGARFEFTQGEKNIQDRTLRLGVSGAQVAARVTLGRRADNGFDNAFDTHRTEFVNGRLDWRISGATDLSVMAGGSAGVRGEGPERLGDGTRNTFYPPHYRDAGAGFGHLRLRHVIGPDNELTLQAYQNRESAQDRWNAQFLGALPPAPQNADRLAQRDNVELQHVFRPFAQMRISWGGEWRRDSLLSPYTLGTNRQENAYLNRLFLNGEWRVRPTVIVNAGAMREDHSISGVNIAPRAFLNWVPLRGQALRIGWSRGYRTPTIFEERANWVSRQPPAPIPIDQFYLAQGGLRAERVDAREIGYVGEWSAIRGTIDVRIFEERFQNWLCRVSRRLPPGSELDPESRAWSFSNCDGEPRTRGYEAAIKLRPIAGMLIVGGYGYVNTVNEYRAPPGLETSPQIAAARLLFPQRQGHLLVKQTLPWRIDLSVAFYKLMQEQRLSPSQLGGGLLSTADVKPYERLDVRVAKRLRIGSSNAELAIVGQNLNRPTQDFYATQTFTRRWFASLAVDL